MLDILQMIMNVKNETKSKKQIKEALKNDLGKAKGVIEGATRMLEIIDGEGLFYDGEASVKTFNDYTWEEIKELVDSGNHPFKVGDIKTINFRDEEYEIVIIGINHDGQNTITCQFRDIVSHKEMNDKATNEGGFYKSYLYDYLNKDFKEELDKVIPVLQYSKLFLPSEFEVFGKNKYSDKENHKQYEYYKDKRNRVKFDKESDCSKWHWLRSAYSSNSNYFAGVSGYGNVNYSSANVTFGVSPCFVI